MVLLSHSPDNLLSKWACPIYSIFCRVNRPAQILISHRADGPHSRLLDFLSSRWAIRVNGSEQLLLAVVAVGAIEAIVAVVGAAIVVIIVVIVTVMAAVSVGAVVAAVLVAAIVPSSHCRCGCHGRTLRCGRRECLLCADCIVQIASCGWPRTDCIA